jgi:hypothetical protein
LAISMPLPANKSIKGNIVIGSSQAKTGIVVRKLHSDAGC